MSNTNRLATATKDAYSFGYYGKAAWAQCVKMVEQPRERHGVGR